MVNYTIYIKGAILDTLISAIDDVINHVKNELQAGRRYVPVDKDIAAAFLAASPTIAPAPVATPAAPSSPSIQAPHSATKTTSMQPNVSSQTVPQNGGSTYKKYRGTNIAPLFAFIGYEPSFDATAEDKAFSGEQGALLDKMIAAMGLTEKEYIVLNIFEEPARSFTGHAIENQVNKLKEFISTVDPRVIILMGDEACGLLLKTKSPVANIHGVRNQLFGKPCIPTYHPKNLLRFIAAKKSAWADLKAALAILNRQPPKTR